MKLFNKTIDRQLFKQYALGSDLSKQEVVVKIFNPSGAGSWYILNSDPQDPDYLWAIVDLGYGAEVGSVSRNDLESYRGRFGLGFERDLGFDSVNAEELYKGLRQGNFYADGGNLSRDRKFVNRSQDYEVEYSKGKNRKGYGSLSFADGGGVASNKENKPSVFYFYDGENERTFSTLEKALEEAKYVDQHKVRDNLGGEYFVEYEDIYPKKNKLEKGGKIAKGSKYGDWAITQYDPLEYDDLGGINGGLIKLVNQDTIEDLIIRNDNALRGNSWFISYKGVRIEDKNPKVVIEKVLKIANRQMAIGGEVKDIKGKILGTILKESKTKGFENKPDNNKVLRLIKRSGSSESYGVQIGRMIYPSENINEAEEEFKLLQQGYKNNFADGGNISDFTDNQQMIMNQNVELEHHHEELEDILEDKVPVPAWVVAKMATATQSISDVTHYLDGEKELMEEEMEDENEEEDEEEVSSSEFFPVEEEDEIENKEVVEPINVTAETKAEMTKKFTDQALGNLKGFLKGMEGIELRDDYTFDYKNEQYEIEPIINSDQNGVSNAVFTIFDSDGEEVGEVAYSREGGKQKFTANSKFFGWDRTKFEDGGFMNNIYADGGIVDVEKVNKADEIYREHNRERKEKGIENFSKESVALWNKKYDNRLQKLKLTFEEKNALNPKKWYADGGYFDGTIPKVSTYMNTYVKGGEIAKAEILGLKRNIMGTTDIEMRISGMRKAQDFIVYPIGKDDAGSVITIQSETRIGQINLVKGVGVMSQSHSSGAYFVHLQMDKLTPFRLSESDLENIKSHIFKTAGANVGSSIVKSDNSGASRLFANGGSFDDEFDGIAYAKTKGKESIDWDKELRDYVGSDYSKFTQREKEEIISDMQRDWDRSNSYAKGGVTYFNNDNQHRLGRPSGSFEKEIYAKVKDRIDSDSFVGSFGWKILSNKKSNIADGFLYKLDDYDQNLIKNLNLKQGEKVFRYVNRTTAIGGMMPFIKINIEKALLYFPVSNDNDDIIFETRGVTPMWINLIQGSFADGGLMNDVYADGGQIRVGDRYKFNWTDTNGNKGYTIREVVKQNVTSGKDFRTKVMVMKVVESSMPETVGRMEEEYKPNFKKRIETGMEISMQEGKPRMTDDYAKGGGIENDGYNLKDINGKKIKVGDFVKTTQPSGGLMSPANPETGIVEKTKDAFGNDALQIRYRKQGANYDRFILLNGKINEIVDESSPSFEEGSFMNNVYAKGGGLSEIETSKSGKLKTNGEVEESWYNTFAEGVVNKKGEEVGVKMNDINKGIVYYQALAKDTPENREGYGWEEHNDEVGFIYKKFATIDDLERFVDKKDNNPKYILKADIKTVTIKRNGKEVTYKGADVLNGANILAKGGDLTSKANYIPKRDVVSVELKDGTTVKPVNGYWVKKGAEPIGAEPKPTSSGKSEPKIDTTQIRKDARGNWRAETNIENFNGYDWRISTVKTYSGNLVSSAQGGKTESTGTKGIVMFKYTMYQDPNYTLEVSKPSRLTDKVVAEQHAKGLAKFKKFMETGMFRGGGKISNFDKLSDKVAKQYEGKAVKNQYQEEYGKYYSREEAQEVGDKVAGKVKAMQTDKKAFGGLFKNVKDLTKPKPKYPNLEGKQVPLKSGEFVMVFTQDDNTLSVMNVGKIGSGVKLRNIDISEVDMANFKAGGQTENKKAHSGSENLKQANDLAKKIRMDGESWLEARKRAFAQLKKQNKA